MTRPVIRTLDESTAHVFDTMPDPLRTREAYWSARHRPDWKRVPLRDGTVVARGAWWGGPDDPEPLTVDLFDVAEGEGDAGAELPRTAPWRVDGLELNLPSGRRAEPLLRAAAETRFTAARKAGYELLSERFVYRWTPECGFPERPGRLVFSWSSGEPSPSPAPPTRATSPWPRISPGPGIPSSGSSPRSGRLRMSVPGDMLSVR